VLHFFRSALSDDAGVCSEFFPRAFCDGVVTKLREEFISQMKAATQNLQAEMEFVAKVEKIQETLNSLRDNKHQFDDESNWLHSTSSEAIAVHRTQGECFESTAEAGCTSAAGASSGSNEAMTMRRKQCECLQNAAQIPKSSQKWLENPCTEISSDLKNNLEARAPSITTTFHQYQVLRNQGLSKDFSSLLTPSPPKSRSSLPALVQAWLTLWARPLHPFCRRDHKGEAHRREERSATHRACTPLHQTQC